MAEHEPSPAQLALRRTMEQISEERWAAGWYTGLERILWDHIMVAEDETRGVRWHELSREERDVLRWLAEQAGGWWTWPRGALEPRFVPRGEWLQEQTRWELRNSGPHTAQTNIDDHFGPEREP